MMAGRGLYKYLNLITVIVLYGSQPCIGETVRRFGPPSIQIMELDVSPMEKEGDFTYTGVFKGPSDTEFEYNGDELDVKREGNNVFTATIRSKDFNRKRGLKLKSNSSREELGTNLNNKYNLPSQTQFLENSCEIGIEKFANGNATEFIATVRNCPSTDQLEVRKSLYVTVRDRHGDAALVWSGNPFGHYKDDNIFDYHKYVQLYYKGSEKDVHYAVLNFPAMKDDNITLVNFWFMLSFSEPSPYQEANMVAPFRVWSYNF